MSETKMPYKVLRSVNSEFKTREDGDDLFIEGYFAVFNSDYNIAPGMSESIAPGAFTDSLANDVRCLINHDSTLVLGRTKSHTYEIRQDEHGLWGKVRINPKDSDAMNAYERVKRGDVDGCSIGFNVVSEETDFRENGDVHWTITGIELFEGSVCTFPAYEETNISARSKQREELEACRSKAWREKMKERLKKYGTESTDVEEKD